MNLDDMIETYLYVSGDTIVVYLLPEKWLDDVTTLVEKTNPDWLVAGAWNNGVACIWNWSII